MSPESFQMGAASTFVCSSCAVVARLCTCVSRLILGRRACRARSPSKASRLVLRCQYQLFSIHLSQMILCHGGNCIVKKVNMEMDVNAVCYGYRGQVLYSVWTRYDGRYIGSISTLQSAR